MKGFFKNYSLSIVLVVLFAISLIGQVAFQWQEYVRDEFDKGQYPSVSDFIPVTGGSILENWQSEFLQLFIFVILSSFLIHKGSPQSKDGDEKMEKTLSRIEDRLEKIERKIK